jgi:hypothetical protein
MQATHKTHWTTAAAIVATGLALTPMVGHAGQANARARTVTFTKDIAPILQRSCQSCHRPDSIAPMSLLTYEEVRPWARSIKLKTTLREMPPWFIEKNIGVQHFKDDPSLSDEEIATVAAWADNGAPNGNPADLPPPRVFTDGKEWTIGKPDLIVLSPVHNLKAVAADFYGLLDSSPTGLTEDRYIKAVEIKEKRLKKDTAARKSGDLNLFVVHHAVITGGVQRDLDALPPEGDPAQAVPQNSRAGGGFNVVYEVGQNATIYPDTLGVKLAAGSVLNWDVHLHSIGTEMPFQIEVGFKLHPKGYEPKYTSAGIFGVFPTYDLDIPAGESNVRMEGAVPVPFPAMMTTFEPHLHSSGKRMCVEAVYPNGSSEMLNCAAYNHNWVKVYSYDDDVAPLLPQGTILKITAWFDNTSKNPRVVDPRNWKGYGNRSIDDMFAFLPRMTRLTDAQFKEEADRREAKRRTKVTSAQTASSRKGAQ